MGTSSWDQEKLQINRTSITMELNEFVKATIMQIVEGVDEANTALSKKTAFVASANIQTDKGFKNTVDKEGRQHYVTDVDFDVAINIQNSNSKEGGGGIEILSVLNIGKKGSSENTNSSTSRIKFSLPLALPTEPDEKLYTRRQLCPPKRPEI